MTQALVIPPKPDVLMEIQDLMAADRLELDTLTQLIKQDVSLFSILMSAVNSPWFGFKNEVESIDVAVSLLGLKRITNLLQAIMVRSCFKGSPLQDHFWDTATEVASISDNLAKQYGILNAEHAYTTGMLHNIGVAIMHKNFDSFANFMETASHFSIDRLCVIQRQTFQTDHFLQGAKLTQSWFMPKQVSQAIRYQPIAESILNGRKEVSSDAANLLAILTLAKNISNDYRHYWNIQEDEFQLKTMDAALNYLDIHKNEFKEYKEDYVENLMANE